MYSASESASESDCDSACATYDVTIGGIIWPTAAGRIMSCHTVILEMKSLATKQRKSSSSRTPKIAPIGFTMKLTSASPIEPRK